MSLFDEITKPIKEPNVIAIYMTGMVAGLFAIAAASQFYVGGFSWQAMMNSGLALVNFAWMMQQ